MASHQREQGLGRPLERLTFDAARFVVEYPPRWRDRNKRVVFEVACPPGSRVGGTVTYTRWGEMTLPAFLEPGMRTELDPRADAYDYVPTDLPPPRVEWHVNFADPALFFAYASGLFAQDEMQVAEHPVLGALREALLVGGHRAVTEEDGRATPVLVRGAERRVAIATEPDAAAGRPEGLYGNRFAAADAEAVRRATTRVDPPTITNVIAIAAPAHGRGAYTAGQVERILATAYTGFAAAAIESRAAAGDDARAVVHTGFWGCGAFGGNRQLMALLQVLASRLAGVRRLVFHAFDGAGLAAFERAMALHERAFSASCDGPIATSRVIDRVVGMGLRWGASDGN